MPVALPAPSAERLAAMLDARNHAAKGALAMIDHANNKPENRSRKPKVGGHQASSMSLVDVLSALYLHLKRPQDRVAVKPHAAPIVYSLAHLMGILPREQMNRLREYRGPQPYPTKTKNPLFVDYTTSSEALGVCAAIYDAYGAVVQNRAVAAGVPGFSDVDPVDALYYGLCGDGELTEGQIDESLYDAGRWGLDNLVWVVDLNRQSLDRVMDDWAGGAFGGRLDGWVEAKFRGQGWHTKQLRWGERAKRLFENPGGDVLRACLDRADDATLHPIPRLPGTVLRALLLGKTEACETPGTSHGTSHERFAGLLGRAQKRWSRTADEQAAIATAIRGVDDAQLQAALGHLGGHDLAAICDALIDAAAHPGQPVVVIAHTIKGYQTSAAAHPENHGMLLPSDEVANWGSDLGVVTGDSYPHPSADSAAAALLQERATTLFHDPDHSYAPGGIDAKAKLAELRLGKRQKTSTGEAFQSLNMAVLRTELAPWLHVGAPDVGQTTHLGPMIKATGVFAARDLPDTFDFMRDGRELAFNWRPAETGQFHALGIAEGNAMLWAYAFGRRKKRVEAKRPVLPIVTVYDKFFERGFNQLDYAAYSDARFLAVGVPSGTGLSRETGTHQSVQTPRMVMDLPGIIAYEPAFAADVDAIYRWALGQLWDDDGEAVYLRLTTQPLPQPESLPDDHAEQCIAGGYWLTGPDRHEAAAGQPETVLIASGRMVQRAREAAEVLAGEGIGVRILNVTSYEKLWRGWDAWNSDPTAWADDGQTYRLHELFEDVVVNAPLVLIGDHHPSVCEWLPGALQRLGGYRILAPRKNSEAGDLDDIDRHHGCHTDDVVAAVRAEISWRKRMGV